MVVALGTGHGRAQPNRGRGVDPVDHILGEVLLGVGAAFGAGHSVAIESGGDSLIQGGVGQQVTRQLLHGELVEGLVGIESRDHPIAVLPHRSGKVDMVTVRVGIAGQIQPVHGHALAEVGRSQQPVHQLLVSPRALLGKKILDFPEGGRESNKVEGQAPNEGPAVRFRRGTYSFPFQPGQNEKIDGICWPALVLHLRE